MFRFFIRRVVFLLVPLGIAGFLVFQGNAFGGNSEPNHFLRLDFAPDSETPGENSGGRFFLTFSGNVRGKIRKEVGIPLFYIDILGASVEMSPLITPFRNGPARLVRLTQISQQPPVVRATFFLRSLFHPRVRLMNNGMEVAFESKEPERNILEPSPKPIPYSLMSPEPVKPVVASSVISLDVQKAEAGALLRELARQAGMNLHSQIPLDVTLDLTATAATPLDAMNIIALKLGAHLAVEDDEIWITTKVNPLLAFSENDVVQGADLRGLGLGDVLRALGQMGELNVVLDPSMSSLKDRPVDMLLTKMSYRQAFETILKLNNLTVRSIDTRTVLVMTEKEARRSAESVIRVVTPQTSLKKVLEILKSTLPPEDAEKVSFKEDMGNLIMIGAKDPIDKAMRVVENIEGKLKRAGEGIERQFFKVNNTKVDDLIKLVQDTLGEGYTPKISKDDRNDTLIISGSKEVVDRTVALMKDLDRPATPQALIHIKLVELHRSDVKNLGLAIQNDHITAPDIGNVKGKFPIAATLNFLEQTNRLKTLANPTLRCTDKEESSIDISEQIPVKNTVTDYLPVASSSLAARTSDNWTTAEIGIKMSLKPYIHSDRQISMEINVDFTELIEFREGHPRTAKRNIKTKIRVKDREAVVIGGLIRRKDDRNQNPIPLLNRLPLLKWLTRAIDNKSRNQEETEMVIIITPTIVGPGNVENPEDRPAYSAESELFSPPPQKQGKVAAKP